jgi:flagellar motor switch protein FliG
MAKNDLPAIRKAAVFLLSLDKPVAAKVLAKMEPPMVEAVTVEIARLNEVDPDEQNAVFDEFLQMRRRQGGERGGMDTVRELIEQSLGEGAGALLENVRQSIQSVPFGFLQRADPENLVAFIAEEHPQTIALILSHLPPHHAAAVLNGLAAEKQVEIIRRVAMMEQTSPEVIQEVEHGLEERLASIVNQQFESAGGVGAVAEMLNVTDRATERAILENLEQEDPDLVEQIRRLMFVFDDLTKLDDRSIQAVFKNVETSQWALALKGASEELKEKVFTNMSSRAATMLKEEIEYLGPVRLSAVEQAQQQIVDVVRRLEDAGEVIIGGADQSEQFVQ